MKFRSCIYSFVLFCSISYFQADAQVTEIITDYRGYWRSGRPVIDTVRPDNSHSLLAFKYRNLYYSTGINDAVLTANGIVINPGDYRALPVSSVSAPGSGTYIGLGQLYDGVDNGPSNPTPVNNIPFYLTDGPKGLNLGTAVYNLPVSNIRFDVSNFQIPKIGDSIPDILVTQMGETSTSSLDVLYFSNANGDTVGNSITIRFTGIDTLGLGTFDFYTANTNPMVIASGGNFTKSPRAIRFFAADLSAFGLNGTNITTVQYFTQRLSGTSDIAFVAYNAEAIKIVPDNNPGCFSNLPGIWVKANDGTSTISNNGKISLWQDRSPNAYSLEQPSASLQPQFRIGANEGFNFNPYLNFDAVNRLVSANSPFAAETSNADFFIVGRPTNTVTGRNKILGFSRSAADNLTSSQGDFPELSYNQNGASVIDNANSSNPLTGTSANLNSAYLWQTNYTNGSAINFFKNGIADGTGGTAANVGRLSFQMGDATPGDNLSDFDVAEAIVFPQNLSATERNQVETYLAIKYGITLSHNYISGAAATTWNLAANTGYNNNIFGIGREDCQGLHQKQSRSLSANALVTIGNVSIASENNTNFNSLTNVTYSIMGDDGGSLNWQTTEKPAKIELRIGREWRVRETGTVGTLLLRVPASTSTQTVKLPEPANCKMYLLVDNDGDFTSGIIMQVAMTLNGTNWEASYNFSDGNYYTFATENKDYGDLPVTWPSAYAIVNGCDVNNDGIYSNADNNSNVLVWAGSAITTEATASTTNTDGADDGLQFTFPTFSPGYTYPFYVLLNSNTANTTVYYRLWFDWNNDGNFANDNSIQVGGTMLVPATYAGSGVVSGSGALTVTVNVKPPYGASPLFKVRLIVSNSVISDMYRTSGSTYQFALTNGEVEDYIAPAVLLPVALKNFTATLQQCTALLRWETITELNGSHFSIEHSTNGVHYVTINNVASKNSSNGAAYNYTIGQLPSGTHYFRLKLMDKDGTFTYSQVVTMNADCTGSAVVLSPNPARNNLIVKGLAKNSQIVVSDATGRILLTKKAAGVNMIHLNLEGWLPGVYTLQVIENGKSGKAYKFMKMK